MQKIDVMPFASLIVPRVWRERGPGGDFTTERMCLAQLGHCSTSARWFQATSSGARTTKLLSTTRFTVFLQTSARLASTTGGQPHGVGLPSIRASQAPAAMRARDRNLGDTIASKRGPIGQSQLPMVLRICK